MKNKISTLAEVPEEFRIMYRPTGDGYELEGSLVALAMGNLRKQSDGYKRARDEMLVHRALASAAEKVGGVAKGALDDLCTRAMKAMNVADDASVTIDGDEPDVFIRKTQKVAPHLFTAARGASGERAPGDGGKVRMVPRSEMGKYAAEIAARKVVVDPNS